jgi:hypothetical protein
MNGGGTNAFSRTIACVAVSIEDGAFPAAETVVSRPEAKHPRIEERCRCRSSHELASEPLDDARLRALAATVSKERLQETVETLVARFPTRHTQSRYLGPAARWIAERFGSLGYACRPSDPVPVQMPGVRAPIPVVNVVCRKEGARPDAPVRIVCAHFDSRAHRLADPNEPAPGANDNGSGVAAIIELARVLKDVPLDDTIEFLATSGEEQGLGGALLYAGDVHRRGVDVRFALNLDEIGLPDAQGRVVVERDCGDKRWRNNQPSQELADYVERAALHVLGIPTKCGHINDSDYMPFEALGYVAIGLYQSGKSPRHHTSQDTPDKVCFAYVAQVTKVALAALLRDFPHPAPAA